MLNKTLRRLLAKESSKPLHCIDTSVLLESELDTKLGEVCRKHLNNMGNGKFFRGVLPVSVLGEINLVIFRDISDPGERTEAFNALERFVRFRNISLAVPKKEDYTFISELMNLEPRLDELDTEHLICAKRSQATAFITLDKLLINNKTLETKLKLGIKHPEDFV